MEKSEFYTLQGYRTKNKLGLTESMEDYLEMIYRISLNTEEITIKELASSLNVKPSSASKMCVRLKQNGMIDFERYQSITITQKGTSIGSYLLWRHQLLETLFRMINQEEFHLEQVEKVEHFIDIVTLKNIEQFIQKQKPPY